MNLNLSIFGKQDKQIVENAVFYHEIRIDCYNNYIWWQTVHWLHIFNIEHKNLNHMCPDHYGIEVQFKQDP